MLQCSKQEETQMQLKKSKEHLMLSVMNDRSPFRRQLRAECNSTKCFQTSISIRALTQSTKDMSPHRTVNRIWRPSLLKLPPVSNRMKVETNKAPMVYSRAQCTGGSKRQAVA